MQTELDPDELEFHGVDQREHVTRGPLIAEAGTHCERCEGEFDVGDRTYLIGRNVGGDDQCCKHCAVIDGANDAGVRYAPVNL